MADRADCPSLRSGIRVKVVYHRSLPCELLQKSLTFLIAGAGAWKHPESGNLLEVAEAAFASANVSRMTKCIQMAMYLLTHCVLVGREPEHDRSIGYVLTSYIATMWNSMRLAVARGVNVPIPECPSVALPLIDRYNSAIVRIDNWASQAALISTANPASPCQLNSIRPYPPRPISWIRTKPSLRSIIAHLQSLCSVKTQPLLRHRSQSNSELTV